MRRTRRIALTALALSLFVGMGVARAKLSAEAEAPIAGVHQAEAEAPIEGVHQAEAHGEHATEHISACSGEAHWNIVSSLAPNLREDLCEKLGDSYIEGKPARDSIHIVMALLVFAVALLFVLLARRSVARRENPLVPEDKLTLFTFFDLLIEAVLNTMTGLMGEKKAREYLPLIASLAIFILFSNLAGAIPGLLPPTDNLNTTFALGSVVFFTTHYAGIKEHGLSYFKEFLGPIVKWYALPLMIIMVFIETISHIVRPASLAIRLMGNIFGDHTVLGIFLTFGLFIPLPIQALGLIVAIVQTLVFCLLSIVYISMAVEHAEGH